MMTKSGVDRLVLKKILNHTDREVTAVYDRYQYDKEKQVAMLTWNRCLKKIITNPIRTKPKKVLHRKIKQKGPKKVLPKKQIKENSNTITYEQFLMEANLRDFTKKK
jgi:hypothetical protein